MNASEKYHPSHGSNDVLSWELLLKSVIIIVEVCHHKVGKTVHLHKSKGYYECNHSKKQISII